MLEPLGHVYDPTTDKSGTNPRFYNGDIVKGHLRPPRHSTDPVSEPTLDIEGVVTRVHTPFEENGSLNAAGIRPTYSISSDVVVSSADPQSREHSIFTNNEDLYGDRYVEHRVRNRVPEEFLTLVRRGNYWKYFHGEELSFKTVHEEGQFWLDLGYVEDMELRRKKKLRTWTRRLLVESLENHEIDTYVRSDEGFIAYRYIDQAVGNRVREHTLQLLHRWWYE